MIHCILNEEGLVVVIDEIVNNENFEKSGTEIETYESLEELKFQQEYAADFSFDIFKFFQWKGDK